MTKKIFILFLFSLISFSGFCQLHKYNSTLDSAGVDSSKAISIIKVSIFSEKDSTTKTIRCEVVEGKDVIKITARNYEGYKIDFHRSKSKSMYSKKLDTMETYIDIKTIFSGVFYLDLINAQGIKVKTFKIEKVFSKI